MDHEADEAEDTAIADRSSLISLLAATPAHRNSVGGAFRWTVSLDCGEIAE
jgi:hypothetical protein